MPISLNQFLRQFAKQALDERVSLFLGAGGSREAGYPNWAELFSPIADDLGTPITEATDFYRLAQYYSNTFGQAELRKRINERINKSSAESPLLSELIKIGFTNIWTTNFDNAIESSFQKNDVLINKVFKDADFSNIDINKRINIFKMNGDVTNLEGIVATQSDYEQYIDTHRIMLMFFKRELLSSTFLFIGYSFTDHLVLGCLSEITRYLGGTSNYHYTILKNRRDDPYFKHFVDDLEQRYHIRVLLVEDYCEITNVLKRLNTRIQNRRVFISGAFRSYDERIEEYSHNLAQSLSKHLLKADYRIVNGIGRHFGTHLIGYANEYLAKQGIKDTERYLIIKPFVRNNETAAIEKKAMRQKVIGQCGAAIYIFGDPPTNSPLTDSGVWEEYQIAHEQHKVVIPIAYPGMVSSIIWETVMKNVTEFPYLERVGMLLDSQQPTEIVAKVIVQILDSIQERLDD